jgi:transposase
LEEQIGALDLAIISKIKMAGLQQRWDLLQTLRPIQNRSAATILAKTGGNMEHFPTGKDLSSWAAESVQATTAVQAKTRVAAPRAAIPWLRAALTECAWAAATKRDRNCAAIHLHAGVISPNHLRLEQYLLGCSV